MSDIGSEKSAAILRQKITPPQSQIRRADQAFEKSLHKSLGQTALRLFGLRMQIREHSIAQATALEIAETTEPYLMLALLENSGFDPGFIAFDQAAIAGLVTMQTLGCILPNLTQGRTATLTDAALIAPLIEETLKTTQNGTDITSDISHRKNYHFSQMISDAHRLSLAMRSEDFTLFYMGLEMGTGQHQAKILMAFPAIEHKVSDMEMAPEQETDGIAHKAFLSLPAEMRAELHRFRFPLSELSQLKVGAHLILPDTALNNIQLRAVNSSDTISAKLGRLAQFRAVQVDIASAPVAHYSADPANDPKQIEHQADEASIHVNDAPQDLGLADPLQIDMAAEDTALAKVPIDPEPA